MKIVVPMNLGLTLEQKKHLDWLWSATFFDDDIKDPKIWRERVKKADIICSESIGLSENLYCLKNVFISIPFVSLGNIDIKKLKENKVTIANAPWCNKYAVVERILGAVFYFMRNFWQYQIGSKTIPLKIESGIYNKNFTILWKGNIGSLVGNILIQLGANVSYFQRNDNLFEKTKHADVVINCLSLTPETKNILNHNFFSALKDGVIYITSSKSEIHDIETIKKHVATWKIWWFADDCASQEIGDMNNEYYKILKKLKNSFITPHIAWSTTSSIQNGNTIMIENVEARINKTPQNILT